MVAEADGSRRGDVDEEGVFLGGVEGHAEHGCDFGKGENVGDGGRIEPDGERNEEHSEDSFGVGRDRAAAVSAHNKRAGVADNEVGQKASRKVIFHYRHSDPIHPQYWSL